MFEKQDYSTPSLDNSRLSLRADCESCFGLCCVSLPFAASVDFAMDKDAGKPCQNLREEFRCGVHDSLRERGFRGCTVYDCFGAGQQVSQFTYNGRDWRQAPESAKQMFEVFPIMRQLHELLWYLSEALALQPAQALHDSIREALGETQRLTRLRPASLMNLDVAAHRANVNSLLMQTSELVREDARRRHKGPLKQRKGLGRGVDLIGANLKGADLRYANLRGAYLIAADLRGADLRVCDLIGADFRDTDLRGADLTSCLFLTQFQLNAAKGNADTKLPPSFARPDHWSA
ncbi:pentapeptide repeat-containing protein [Cohnella herbarum]|uniref:Pentapeptide repeat-containing protein n=1 Tax=Cohnella herbarum TaxID=2728023 RepID=A0A7Z2ZNC3_9BACL|nr:pentapeptide repeat-containing protein [Cohnella herbarum]QJD86048.1 pentapeptide repeat-containing protein [Cohnella herbarum]